MSVYPFGKLVLPRENASLLITIKGKPDHVVCVTSNHSQSLRKYGWNLPSGGIKQYTTDHPESRAQAAAREGFEETGIEEIRALADGFRVSGINLHEEDNFLVKPFCELIPVRDDHAMPLNTFYGGNKYPEYQRIQVFTSRDYVYKTEIAEPPNYRALGRSWRGGVEDFRVMVVDVMNLDLHTFSRGHANVLHAYRKWRCTGETPPPVIRESCKVYFEAV